MAEEENVIVWEGEPFSPDKCVVVSCGLYCHEMPNDWVWLAADVADAIESGCRAIEQARLPGEELSDWEHWLQQQGCLP